MTEHKDVIIVTTDAVPGRNVQAVLGMVWGMSVDYITSFNRQKRMDEVSNMMRVAYYSLAEQARSMGADAVIGVHVDSFVAQEQHFNREYTFYGTAVRLD